MAVIEFVFTPLKPEKPGGPATVVRPAGAPEPAGAPVLPSRFAQFMSLETHTEAELADRALGGPWVAQMPGVLRVVADRKCYVRVGPTKQRRKDEPDNTPRHEMAGPDAGHPVLADQAHELLIEKGDGVRVAVAR